MTLGSNFNALRGPGNLYGPRIYAQGNGLDPQIGDFNRIITQDTITHQEVGRQEQYNARHGSGVYDPLYPPSHQPYPNPKWSAPRIDNSFPVKMEQFPYPATWDGTYRVPLPQVVQNYVPHNANLTKPRNRYPYDQWAMVGRPTGYNLAPDHGYLRAPVAPVSRSPRMFYQIQIRDSGGAQHTYVGARAPTWRQGFNATITRAPQQPRRRIVSNPT